MQWQGVVLVLLGCILQAAYIIINKRLVDNKAPADCVGVANYLGGGVILMIGALWLNPPEIESWSSLFWPLAATCALNVIIGYGQIRALKYADASLVAPIAATQPMVVLIPAYLVLGEVPNALGYWGLFLMAVGMYVFFATEVENVSIPDWYKRRFGESKKAIMGAQLIAPLQAFTYNKGVRIAFLVAFSGAVSINFDKLAAQRSSPMFAVAVILLFIGIVGLIKTTKKNEWANVKKEHLKQLMINPLVYVCIMICYWFAFNYAFAAYVGALKRLNAIIVMAFAFFILKETKVLKRWPGGLIMTIGAVLITLD